MFAPRLLRPAARSFGCRTYATSPTPNATANANWPLYLSVFGVTGFGYWVYLQQTGKLVGGNQPRSQASTSLTSASPACALDKDEFRVFALKKVDPYNYNTSKYTFSLPEGTATQLPVASCVLLRLADENALKDDKGKPVIHPYTPISPSDLQGEVQFLIKKYDNGKMTPHLAELKPGDKVAIKGPIPKFAYKANQFTHAGMIAGGSGITPMYQLVSYALSIPDDKTKFTLIFANVSSKDILLKEEFDRLKKENPERFEVVYVIDKPEEAFKGPTGFVTKELIKEHIAGPELGEKVKLFVCGPPGQVQAVAGKKDGMKQGALGGALKDLGYNEDQVFKF